VTRCLVCGGLIDKSVDVKYVRQVMRETGYAHDECLTHDTMVALQREGWKEAR
jgi:hypothetical protein